MIFVFVKDNSYFEFKFSFPVVGCYDDTNACLFALKNVTFMEMVVLRCNKLLGLIR